MARHRKPIEDGDDLTDIIAVEVPESEIDDAFITLESEIDDDAFITFEPSKRSWAPRKESGPTNVKHGGFTPMFRGFDRTAELPRTDEPLAADRNPPESPALIRRRLTIMALSVGLALTSFGLMLWSFMSQPTCAKPPPLRPPITVTVTPGVLVPTR